MRNFSHSPRTRVPLRSLKCNYSRRKLRRDKSPFKSVRGDAFRRVTSNSRQTAPI